MQHVRQPPDSYLCQACCTAMLANVDLQYVLDRARLLQAPDGSGKVYMTNRETIRFLLEFGLTIGAAASFPFVQQPDDLNEIHIVSDLSKQSALVGVRSEKYPDGEHAVVWDHERRMILDPQLEDPQPLSRYRVYEWWPLVLLEG